MKTVKPTASEKKVIDKRLKNKYPQMYAEGSKKLYTEKPSWANRLKMKVQRVLKNKKTVRTKDTENQLQKAGLTSAEIKRLKGKS